MERKKASDFDQRALDLYDDYAHGRISRRDFAQRIAAVTVGGVTAEALIASQTPNYAWAQQIPPDDARIRTEAFEYKSPKGGKKIRGLLARPAKDGKFPAAGVPFYGRQPVAEDVPKIKAALSIHYAELDTRINEGWPAFEKALKSAGTKYQAFNYAGANHGFHNDSTPRYDEAAAKLAWQRTLDFFKDTLS